GQVGEARLQVAAGGLLGVDAAPDEHAGEGLGQAELAPQGLRGPLLHLSRLPAHGGASVLHALSSSSRETTWTLRRPAPEVAPGGTRRAPQWPPGRLCAYVSPMRP